MLSSGASYFLAHPNTSASESALKSMVSQAAGTLDDCEVLSLDTSLLHDKSILPQHPRSFLATR